uniref:Uncharacterized protein n=1 Tax=Desulfovibrio sp. U5L TaxID=596152 RepID=I2PWN0_9BACT
MEDVEWGFWAKCGAWTLMEAILLLECKNPKEPILPFSKFFYNTEQFAIRDNRAGFLVTVDGKCLAKTTEIVKIPIGEDLWTYRRGILAGRINCDVVRYKEREIISHDGALTGLRPQVFLAWADSKEIPIPGELLGILDNLEPAIGRHRNSQLDRQRCEAIAQCLWDKDPTSTIEDIIKHPWIQQFGNGSQYTGKNTLRDWVRKVDPRSSSEKTKPSMSKKRNTPEV